MELPTLDLFFVMARSGIKGMPIPESYVFREGGCQGRFLYDGSSRLINFDANWASVEDAELLDTTLVGGDQDAADVDAERQRRLEAHRRFQIYDRLAGECELEDVVAVLILPVPINRRRLALDYLTASRLRHFLESEVEYDCLVSAFIHPSGTSGPGGRGCYSLAQCVYTSPILFVTEQYTNRHTCSDQRFPVPQRTTTCSTSSDVTVNKISPGTEARLRKHSALIAHAFERCGFPEFTTRDRISLYFAISPPLPGAGKPEGRSFGAGGDGSEIGRWILTFASEVAPLPHDLRSLMDSQVCGSLGSQAHRPQGHTRQTPSGQMEDDVESVDWGGGGMRKLSPKKHEHRGVHSSQSHNPESRPQANGLSDDYPIVVLPGRYTATPLNGQGGGRNITTAPTKVKGAPTRVRQADHSQQTLQDRSRNQDQFRGPWGRDGYRQAKTKSAPWDGSSVLLQELTLIKEAVSPSDGVVRMAEAGGPSANSGLNEPETYVGVKPQLKDASLQGYVSMPNFLIKHSIAEASASCAPPLIVDQTVSRPRISNNASAQSRRSPSPTRKDRTQSLQPGNRGSPQTGLLSSKLFSQYSGLRRESKLARSQSPSPQAAGNRSSPRLSSWEDSSRGENTPARGSLNPEEQTLYEHTYRLNRRTMLDRVFQSRQSVKSDRIDHQEDEVAPAASTGWDDPSTGDVASLLDREEQQSEKKSKQQLTLPIEGTRSTKGLSHSGAQHDSAHITTGKRTPPHDLLKLKFDPNVLLDHFLDACYAAYDEGSLMAQPTDVALRVAEARGSISGKGLDSSIFIALPLDQTKELAAWLNVHNVPNHIVGGEDKEYQQCGALDKELSLVGLRVTLPKRQGATALLKRTLTADRDRMLQRVAGLSDKTVKGLLAEIEADQAKSTVFVIVMKRLDQTRSIG